MIKRTTIEKNLEKKAIFLKVLVFPAFKNKFLFLLFLIVVLFSVAGSGQTITKELARNRIIYIFEMVTDGKNMKLHVNLYFKGEEDGISRLKLPFEWDRQARLYNQIKNLHSESVDTSIKETNEPQLKIVEYKPRQTVHLQYEVVQDWAGDKIQNGFFNRAVLQKDYFYLIGDTFLVHPDWQPTKRVSIELRWKNFPRKWSLANSFGADETRQTINGSLNDITKGIYLGGDFRVKSFPVRGKSVYTAIRGLWNFSDEEFQSLVRRIMDVERTFWNDNDFPYYLVVLFPIDDTDTGGEARTNAFSLYFPQDTKSVFDFKFSLAHELFHLWNPIRLGGIKDEKLYWFSEGFTDYYASLLLLRAGLVSLDEYVGGINELLKLYYTSPARNLTDEQILIARQTNYDAERQPYQRGNLLAYNWNTLIKARSGNKYSLDDVMRSLFKTSRQKGFVLSEKYIDDALRLFLKKGVLSDIEKYIENGDSIAPLQVILGDCFEREVLEIAPFDAGFDIEATLNGRVFKGVRDDSNAYQSGIRNGQKWIGGGMERDPKVLAEFIVEESGIQKTIKYYPAGNNKTRVPQYKYKIQRSSQETGNCQNWFESAASK